MARAISYVRFSTPKQALGDSLRRQLERTKKYCDTHRLTLDETLRDEGMSGYKGEHRKNGHLGLFLAAVEAGRVPRGTYLILEHLDRFSRENPLIALTNLISLINAGIQVVTLFDERTYTSTSKTIGDDLIGAIRYMIVAHGESSRKADLIKETWDGKRQSLATGERKVLTHTCPAWVDVVNGEFVANGRGKATVRRIFELVANGMSTYGVCQLLNAEKVPALSGNKKDKKTGEPIGRGWNTARISEIIKSDAPLGWFQPYRREGAKRVKVGEPIKEYYPKIVSQELANRARYQLSTRSFAGEGSGANGKSMTNLFSGLSKCALCGDRMYLYHHGWIGGRGRRNRFHQGYLRCSNNKRNMGCKNAGSIPYAVFEKFIVELIGGFSIPEDTGEDQATQHLIERLAEAKADAAKTAEAVTMLLNAFTSGASSLVMARIHELQAQYDKLMGHIAEMEKQLAIERGKTKPLDEIEAVKRMMADLASTDPKTRLLARTRTAAGMRRFISHFICFPNRGFIAEYDLGSTMCVIRCWMTPDGGYEVYHTDWDYGQRKGKPWLSFVGRKLHRTDHHIISQTTVSNDGSGAFDTNEEAELRTVPAGDWRDYATDYNPDSKRNRYNRLRMIASLEKERKKSDEGFQFPARIATLSPSHFDLQPEDVVLASDPPELMSEPYKEPTPEQIQEAKDFMRAMEEGPEAEEEFWKKRREGRQ